MNWIQHKQQQNMKTRVCIFCIIISPLCICLFVFMYVVVYYLLRLCIFFYFPDHTKCCLFSLVSCGSCLFSACLNGIILLI